MVTGAGGAIGSGIAQVFADNGARVAVHDIDEGRGRECVERIRSRGGETLFFGGDVGDPGDMERLAGEICDRWGPADILVNNAGVNVRKDRRRPIHEFGIEDWRRIIRVDLDGVYFCSRAVTGAMAARGSGCVINISSVVGLVPFRNQCAFAAAKAGVINLTRAMALELAPHGIRVNAIAPGSILMEDTRALFYEDRETAERFLSHIPLGRPGEPDDIAYAALYLAADEAKYVTGSVLTVDGGWTCGYARDF